MWEVWKERFTSSFVCVLKIKCIYSISVDLWHLKSSGTVRNIASGVSVILSEMWHIASYFLDISKRLTFNNHRIKCFSAFIGPLQTLSRNTLDLLYIFFSFEDKTQGLLAISITLVLLLHFLVIKPHWIQFL